MAVDEDRTVRRESGGPPGDELERTRRLVAVLVSATFLAITLIVVIGGLIGRFNGDLVNAVVTGLGGAVGGIWAFLFRRTRGDD